VESKLLAVPKRPAGAGRAANPLFLYQNISLSGWPDAKSPVSADLKVAGLGLYLFTKRVSWRPWATASENEQADAEFLFEIINFDRELVSEFFLA
jgi:hypothetical protein